MSLTISNKSEDKYTCILGRKYNVEYELGSGKLQTISNILDNVDVKYFWFCSEEDGFDIIRQDRVITMTCIREKIS